MSDDALLILMNQEIDGVNTPDESERLRRALETDPALRREFDGLRAAVGRLENAAIPPTPADLRGRILAATAARAARSVASPASPGRRPPGRRRVAILSFAAGMAAGLAVFAALGPWLSREEADRTRGSVAAADERIDGRAGVWRSVAGDGWHGAARVAMSAEEALFELRLDGGDGAAIVLELPAGARCTSFDLDHGADYDVEVRTGAIVLRGDGASRVRILLDMRRASAGSLLLRDGAAGDSVPLAVWPSAAE